MTTYSEYPTIDALINVYYPDTNYGSTTMHGIGLYASAAYGIRTYMKFPLSGVPENAIVSSPYLYVKTVSAFSNTANVYRCKRNWTSAGVTWNKYDGSNSWQVSGGTGANDYDSTLVGSKSMVTYNWEAIPLDTTLLLSLCGSSPSFGYNYGFFIRGSLEGTNSLLWFQSIEGTDKPYLTFTYEVPSEGLYFIFMNGLEMPWKKKNRIWQSKELELSF